MTARSPSPVPAQPLVGAWLLGIAALVAAMILVGGATRLTDSGLSITEWNLAKQLVPPLTEAGWAREFDLYRQTTEYQVQNRGMSLPAFQEIYWWEWGHRFLGKAIGAAFALPFFAFLLTGRLAGRLWPAAALFALGGLQGYVGWWMVESGLSGRLDVAPYRLAAHLGMAFAILAGALALAAHALRWPGPESRAGAPPAAAAAVAGLLFLQVLAGALVAGSDAGRAFTDWPTIGGALVPAQYWQGVSGFHGWVENHAAVQFAHRTLGYLAALAALGLAAAAWTGGRGAGRITGAALGGLALAQAGLGVWTVTAGAPLSLSLAHQGLAVALWAVMVAHLIVAFAGARASGRAIGPGQDPRQDVDTAQAHA